MGLVWSTIVSSALPAVIHTLFPAAAMGQKREVQGEW